MAVHAGAKPPPDAFAFAIGSWLSGNNGVAHCRTLYASSLRDCRRKKEKSAVSQTPTGQASCVVVRHSPPLLGGSVGDAGSKQLCESTWRQRSGIKEETSASCSGAKYQVRVTKSLPWGFNKKPVVRRVCSSWAVWTDVGGLNEVPRFME